MDAAQVKTIKSSEMLTDVSVNISQNLLHKQFLLCEGLEDTTLGQCFSGGEFAQILFTGQCHWMSATNIGCKKVEVKKSQALKKTWHNCTINIG